MVRPSDWKIVLNNGMYLLDSGLSKSNQDRITGGWEVVKMPNQHRVKDLDSV